MKFSWRPDAFLQLVNAVIPVAVLFGLIKWTPEMQAGAILVIGLLVAFVSVSFMTTGNATLEQAGTSKTQIVEAAAKNVAMGTPGGTGMPNEPGGAGGTSAPKGLGNFSGKDRRGTGSGTGMILIPLLLLGPALASSGCLGSGGTVNLRPAAIASDTFASSLAVIQQQFVVWSDGGQLPRATEQRWQGYFRDAAKIGLAVNSAIAAGDQQGISTNARAAVDLVDRLIRDEVISLPPSQKGAVETVLISLRGFIAIWEAVHGPVPSGSLQIGSPSQLQAIIVRADVALAGGN